MALLYNQLTLLIYTSVDNLRRKYAYGCIQPGQSSKWMVAKAH